MLTYRMLATNPYGSEGRRYRSGKVCGRVLDRKKEAIEALKVDGPTLVTDTDWYSDLRIPVKIVKRPEFL